MTKSSLYYESQLYARELVLITLYPCCYPASVSDSFSIWTTDGQGKDFTIATNTFPTLPKPHIFKKP
jgi:hypothetical protein